MIGRALVTAAKGTRIHGAQSINDRGRKLVPWGKTLCGVDVGAVIQEPEYDRRKVTCRNCLAVRPWAP